MMAESMSRAFAPKVTAVCRNIQGTSADSEKAGYGAPPPDTLASRPKALAQTRARATVDNQFEPAYRQGGSADSHDSASRRSSCWMMESSLGRFVKKSAVTSATRRGTAST